MISILGGLLLSDTSDKKHISLGDCTNDVSLDVDDDEGVRIPIHFVHVFAAVILHNRESEGKGTDRNPRN